MNAMNTNNIDNRLNPNRDTSASKSSIKMGQEKISTIDLKTAPREGEKGSIEKAQQIEVLGKAKVSPKGSKGQKIKRKRKSPLVPWKKPEGMPKRPLSAYNLFFQDRRKEIMESATEIKESSPEGSIQGSRKQSKKKSGVGFANLARTIGTEWRALPSEKKAPYESRAATDKERYDKEMKVWRAKEKEMKAMRESEERSNAQPYDWSTLTSITLARKQYGDELPSLRKSITDPALADLRVGMRPDRRQSTGMMPLPERESRGAFHSSIYGNLNSNASWMDAQPIQSSNMMIEQQLLEINALSSGGLNFSDRRQLSSLNTPVRKDNLEKNFPLEVGSMSASNSSQGNQPLPYQNNPFLSKINSDPPKSTPWGNQRGGLERALNLDNIMSTSLDLEPLPLPDDHQHQHSQNSQSSRESQLDWSSQLGLQQMYAKAQQQQRTTIASEEQYLRRLSTGGAPMFSTGWGQNNSWNMNALDANELVSTPFGTGSNNQASAQKPTMRSPQQTGVNLPAEEVKSRSNNSRSFPSSSSNPNEDLYRFFNDGQN